MPRRLFQLVLDGFAQADGGASFIHSLEKFPHRCGPRDLGELGDSGGFQDRFREAGCGASRFADVANGGRILGGAASIGADRGEIELSFAFSTRQADHTNPNIASSPTIPSKLTFSFRAKRRGRVDADGRTRRSSFAPSAADPNRQGASS